MVADVHRPTRTLDGDRYVDVFWGILSGCNAADARAGREVYLLQIDCHNRRAQGRLEVVNIAGVIENRPPVGRREIGVLRIDDSPRHRCHTQLVERVRSTHP